MTEQVEEWPFFDHDDGPDSLVGAIYSDPNAQAGEIEGALRG